MKYSTSVFLCGCGVALTVAGFTKVALFAKSSPDAGHQQPKLVTMQEIRAYRKWALVNPQPYFVPNPLAVLCAPPSAGTVISPHDGKFIKVYVNAVGQRAMLSQERPRFPLGSVIVKEKLATAKSAQPELMTVMLKRAPGYNPRYGDWEFMVVNGPATKIETRGKLANCQSCHTDKKMDYIFRTYAPDARNNINNTARNSN